MKRERSGGGSKMSITHLLLCVLVASVQSLDVDIDIKVEGTKESGGPTFYHPSEHLDFEFRDHPELNPCQNKECPKGEKCHVIRNSVMLQLPIALCEKEIVEDKHDSDEGCADFVLGSNVFQCKTKLEWEGIAKKQCQIRLAAIAETVFASVRYPCRLGRQSYSAPVFQQVEVSCCELSSATSAPTATEGATTEAATESLTTVDPMTEEAVTKPVETAAPTEWDTWETSGTWPPYTTDLRKTTEETTTAESTNKNRPTVEPMTKEAATKPTTEWGKWKTWTSTTGLRKNAMKNENRPTVEPMTKEPATKPTTEWGKWKTWTSTTDLRKNAMKNENRPTVEPMTKEPATKPTTEWGKWKTWTSTTDLRKTTEGATTEAAAETPATEEPTTEEPMAEETVTEEPKTKEPMTEKTVTKPVKTAAPSEGDVWETPSDTPRDYTTDISKNVPTQDPPHHHLRHLLWFIFPIVAMVTLCSMACITFCIVRTCVARHRLRRAYKRFPADPHQCILTNESYDDTEEVIYSKPNRGMGGYEPANPVLVFRNESSEDMLAYDMFIAGKQ